MSSPPASCGGSVEPVAYRVADPATRPGIVLRTALWCLGAVLAAAVAECPEPAAE